MRDGLDGCLIYLLCMWVVLEEGKSKEFGKLYHEIGLIKRTLVPISSNKHNPAIEICIISNAFFLPRTYETARS